MLLYCVGVSPGRDPYPRLCQDRARRRELQACRPAELTDGDMVEMRGNVDTLPVGGGRYCGAHEKSLNA